MSKIKDFFSKTSKSNYSAAYLVLFVVIGTELFHLVNSIKLNLFMPTIANVLSESTVRSWQLSNGTICIRYGNFIWDVLSVTVFFAITYLLWKFVVKRFIK